MTFKVLTVRLPVEMDEQITEQARVEDLSKNQLIKRAIRMYLEAQQKQAQKSSAKYPK